MQTSDNNIPIVKFEYDFTGRFFGLIFRSLVILIGIFLLQVNEIWIEVIGIVFIFFGTISFLDMLLFESLTFYNDKVVKRWFMFGSIKSNMDNLVVGRSNSFYGGGTIKFWERGKRIKQVLLFGLDLFPLTKKDVEKIKDILVSRNIIEPDNLVWQA